VKDFRGGESVDIKKAPYGWLVKRIASQLEQNMNFFLKPYNITTMQSWVLLHLNRTGDSLTFKELEKQFEVSQPTMVGILSRLEQKDFVLIGPDEKDRRIKRVQISEKGSELIADLKLHLEQSEHFFTDGFSDSERESFHLLLEKAYFNIIESDGNK
jgi:DNA-binding MarR family transcriptional regulator